MIQHKTLGRLASVIQCVAEGEQRTEVIRQVLAEQRHFEPTSAFRRLDKTKSGELSATDIIDFLETNKIVINHKEAKILLRHLDLNADGRVTYSDFAESILPQEDARLKQMANLREGYPLQDGEALPYEAEWSLARVLEQELKNFRSLESLKDALSSSLDYNKLDLFNVIDESKQGVLTVAMIEEFMRSHSKGLSQDQVFGVFRRIGAINAISFPQFADLITPVLKSASTPQQKNNSRSATGLKSIINNTSSTRLNHSKLMEDAEKDNEYQEYLARSANFERSKQQNTFPNDNSSLLYNSSFNNNNHMQSTSPNRRSNYGSTTKYISQQRSPYHSPNKASNLLTQSVYASKFNTTNGSVNIPKYTRDPKKSPMQGNEEEHLVRTLKEQIVLDRDVEELKNALALRQDFSAEDGFRIFDRKARGHVTKFEFELALNDIGIYPTKDEMHLFYKRYDRDNDGLLKFSDFAELVLPVNQELSALSKSRIPNYFNPDDGIANLSLETRRAFKKMLQRVFETELETEYLRQKIAQRKSFSLYNAFMAIDNQDNGFINVEAFKAILIEYGIPVSSTDVFTLIKRYDKNQDNRVSFPEFMNELTPKSPVKQF